MLRQYTQYCASDVCPDLANQIFLEVNRKGYAQPHQQHFVLSGPVIPEPLNGFYQSKQVDLQIDN